MEDPRSCIIMDAKLAEQAERYEDMAEYMKKLVKFGDQPKAVLAADERNLLSVAYKNVVGSRRSAWRVLSSMEEKAKGEFRLSLLKEYKQKVEDELKDICNELIALLDDRLIGDGESSESQIFFQKMKGDYYRYLSEVAASDERKEQSEKSEEAYDKAYSEAKNTLNSTHPIRLGLALNFSVFYYEIKNQPDKACEVAKMAFDDAIAELDTLQEDSYKDSTLIMQLLRDNLTLWTSTEGADDKDEEDA